MVFALLLCCTYPFLLNENHFYLGFKNIDIESDFLNLWYRCLALLAMAQKLQQVPFYVKPGLLRQLTLNLA
tara:strand:- start:88 stop:300 length:213 start_codon:yes stop_codon:yes gene_type:complete